MDNCIQNYNFGELQSEIELNPFFWQYIWKYNCPDESFEHGYPQHTNAQVTLVPSERH